MIQSECLIRAELWSSFLLMILHSSIVLFAICIFSAFGLMDGIILLFRFSCKLLFRKKSPGYLLLSFVCCLGLFAVNFRSLVCNCSQLKWVISKKYIEMSDNTSDSSSIVDLSCNAIHRETNIWNIQKTIYESCFLVEKHQFDAICYRK